MIDRKPVLVQVVQMLRLRDEIVTRQSCGCRTRTREVGRKSFLKKKTKKVVDSERESR